LIQGEGMAGDHEAIVVYGTVWCPDCKRAKQFLGEQRIHYHWVDIERDPQAMTYVEEVNEGKRIVPTIMFPDGSILVEPSNAELAEKLGLSTKAKRTYYDVIVVGGGPAGLSAALYTTREGLETLVIERAAPGGQTGITQIIDNFPGFDEGISGEEFARRLTNQAQRFGVEILQAQEVTGIRTNGRYREVLPADGTCYGAHAVLLATGAHYRRLDVPGENELIGVNIHFCATCDGAFYRDKDVLVIGGGNSAFEEGLFLAVQEFLVEDGRLAGVRVLDRTTNEIKEWHPDGVFVFIGMTPNSGFLPAEIERDRYGFVKTDRTMQTSIKGVFAGGDVRAGATAQAASAAGEGVTVALMIRDYLRAL
jgi:thioredoxin reductase (NADPH)